MKQEEFIGDAAEKKAVVAVVDDEAGVRKMLSRNLQLEGFSCRPFVDGQDFLDALEFETPDCVVLDLRMPGLSGIEVLERLPDRARGIAIFMFSSHGTIPDAVQAIHKGAIDFVEKPVLVSDLAAKIRAALARSSQDFAANKKTVANREFLNRLTPREKGIAVELYNGLTGPEIAEKLDVSSRTVEAHRKSIITKMEARNLPDLVRVLGELGIENIDS